jgi:Transposase and inactivated derivatives
MEKIRKFLGPVFHELTMQRRSKILEVHMLIQIPPNYSVEEVVGYIEGKSTIAVSRQFSGRKKNLNGGGFVQGATPCIHRGI